MLTLGMWQSSTSNFIEILTFWQIWNFSNFITTFSVFHICFLKVGTIRYDSGYLTCSKKLTGSQLSLPHMPLVHLVQVHYRIRELQPLLLQNRNFKTSVIPQYCPDHNKPHPLPCYGSLLTFASYITTFSTLQHFFCPSDVNFGPTLSETIPDPSGISDLFRKFQNDRCDRFY